MKSSVLLLLPGLTFVVACSKQDTSNAAPATSASTNSAPATSASAGASGSQIPATTPKALALEAYQHGEGEFDMGHTAEARQDFKQALRLDPGFVSAMAFEGMTIGGADGEKKIADAIARGTALPAAEQLHLELLRALHAEDRAKAVAVAGRLAAAVPQSSRAHLLYGRALNKTGGGKADEDVTELKQAIKLAPEKTPAYLDLGRILTSRGKGEEGISDLKKYVSLNPTEPSAHEALGDASLTMGQIDEAVASYKKATETDAKFLRGWEGLGFAYLYKGDTASSVAAFDKLREQASNVQQKQAAYAATAWSQVAQNNAAQAMKTLDAWDSEIRAAKNDSAAVGAGLTRAEILVETGKPADAIKLLGQLGEAIDKSGSSETQKTSWQITRRASEVLANERAGKKADAEAALGALKKIASGEDWFSKGALAFAEGEVALANNDASAAAQALRRCAGGRNYCAWELNKALEKLGSTDAGAQKKGVIARRRDGESFYVWSKIAAPK